MKPRLATFATLAVAASLAATVAAPARAEGLSPDDLLAQYQPVTVLDRSESFAPTSVEDFLDDAALHLLGTDGLYHATDVPPLASRWAATAGGSTTAARSAERNDDRDATPPHRRDLHACRPVPDAAPHRPACRVTPPPRATRSPRS